MQATSLENVRSVEKFTVILLYGLGRGSEAKCEHFWRHF
jgi:hypothetical protein